MIIPHCAKFFDHSCSCNGHRMFLVAREPLDDGEAALNDDDVNWFRDEIGTLSIRKSEGTITIGLENTTTAPPCLPKMILISLSKPTSCVWKKEKYFVNSIHILLCSIHLRRCKDSSKGSNVTLQKNDNFTLIWKIFRENDSQWSFFNKWNNFTKIFHKKSLNRRESKISRFQHSESRKRCGEPPTISSSSSQNAFAFGLLLFHGNLFQLVQREFLMICFAKRNIQTSEETFWNFGALGINFVAKQYTATLSSNMVSCYLNLVIE